MGAGRSQHAAMGGESSDVMASTVRITQGTVEVLGPLKGAATIRATQGFVEALGDINTSHTRACQGYVEVLGPWHTGGDLNARITQGFVEVLGKQGTPPAPPVDYPDELWFNL